MKDDIDLATVFAIVPTFNRWSFTAECIHALSSQTYPRVVVVISDGGSTDGTRERLASDYSDVKLVHDGKDRWWAGSTALGIDLALAQGSDRDFVLLINNDTLIPDDYVETLVAASGGRYAVGALIVDSRDRSVVLDAGEFIDWNRYDFPVRCEVPVGVDEATDIDVLPGRGSLVPLAAIRKAGNVDDAAFPHYLADYDFFCRVKSAGYPLKITFRTRISAHIEETGIAPKAGRTSYRQIWRELFSRRSMTNVVDHWRFIERHAPRSRVGALHWILTRRAIGRVALGGPLGPLVAGPLWLITGVLYNLKIVIRCALRWRDPDARLMLQSCSRPLNTLMMIAFLPRPVRPSEVEAHGLVPEKLQQAGTLRTCANPEWMTFQRLSISGEDQKRFAALVADATRMTRNKLRSVRQFRSDMRSGQTRGEHS